MTAGQSRKGFDFDLAEGEARESAFVEAVRQARVEHKRDWKYESTGNVAVEIRQGSPLKGEGTPSGISICNAQWWAVEFAEDRWLVVRVSKLREIVKEQYEQAGSIMGGDFNRYENVLVPMSRLILP